VRARLGQMRGHPGMLLLDHIPPTGARLRRERDNVAAGEPLQLEERVGDGQARVVREHPVERECGPGQGDVLRGSANR
jgi:hypothetical protein